MNRQYGQIYFGVVASQMKSTGVMHQAVQVLFHVYAHIQQSTESFILLKSNPTMNSVTRLM